MGTLIEMPWRRPDLTLYELNQIQVGLMIPHESVVQEMARVLLELLDDEEEA